MQVEKALSTMTDRLFTILENIFTCHITAVSWLLGLHNCLFWACQGFWDYDMMFTSANTKPLREDFRTVYKLSDQSEWLMSLLFNYINAGMILPIVKCKAMTSNSCVYAAETKEVTVQCLFHFTDEKLF